MSSSDSYQEQLLVKRYQLQEIIGEGAMGKVYRAEDLASKGHIVAVKMLTRSLDDMKMIKNFQREATISALLSEISPHIVKVMDYGIDDQQVPFYVMELLNGESLSDVIEFHQISLMRFFDYIHQICLAIEIAHNGIFFQGEMCPIVHRDLKPSNIVVTEDEEGNEQIKVLDFGIAKLLQTENKATEKFVGTPRYCSPEQLQGLKLDNRSDIYSLGMIMYEMLSKHFPWQLEQGSVGQWYQAHTELLPNKFPPELKIPVELEKLILRCLAKSPSDRPQSAGEVDQHLDRIARKLRIEVSRITLTSQVRQQNQSWSDLEKFYLQTPWPDNKPQQKIVFPRIMLYQNQAHVTLCIMLDREDIRSRKNNIRYNQFLFQSYPHPMILWITVLYSLDDGPRWLPCYLDLKTKIGRQVASILSDSKEYHLLFYPLNKPGKCLNLVSSKVTLKQRTNLKQWGSVAKMLDLKDNLQAVASKRKLKQDFENLKSKIILDLQKSQTQEMHG